MINRALALLSFVLLIPFVAFGQCSSGTPVTFHTSLGDMNVNLLPDKAPKTVTNFLTYVNAGSYSNSIFHRSVQGFVIQGGGFHTNLAALSTGAPIPNEPGFSNTRGTIAMAQLSGNPNSATSQWFFNLTDNSATLDPSSTNPGYTVFGCLSDAASLAVMDKIAAVPIYNYDGGALNEIPLQNYTLGTTIQQSNLVIVTSITQANGALPPVVPSNGIISASGFGGFSAATVGSFIEIYGSNLAPGTLDWSNSFVNSAAPTALDGVYVTIGGTPAYVAYVSPGQINAQVPAGVASGGSVPVIVYYLGQASSPVNLAINSLEGGLLAPANWAVGGRQYVVAYHSKDFSFVTNGIVPNIKGTPAVGGETLVFYGAGFGAVSSASTPIAGQLLNTPVSIANNVQFSFGSTTAKVLFEGLTTEVGIYQFNVTVPYGLPSGDIQLNVTQTGSTAPAQALWIPIK